MKFVLENNKECDIIKTFSQGGINYIVYTDGTKDDNDELLIHASRYIINDKNQFVLKSIEEDYEWDLIDEKLKEMEK